MFIAKVFEYELWGNPDDGFDCNNVFQIAEIKLNGNYKDLADWQILKRLHGKEGFRPAFYPAPILKFNKRYVTICNNYMTENTIFIEDKKTGAIIGHVELIQE